MNKIKITLKRSRIGRPKKHKVILDALALRKINKTVIVPDNDQMRGAIKKVSHLVEVTEEETKE